VTRSEKSLWHEVPQKLQHEIKNFRLSIYFRNILQKFLIISHIRKKISILGMILILNYIHFQIFVKPLRKLREIKTEIF